MLFLASWCPPSQKLLPPYLWRIPEKNPKDCFCIDVGNKPDVCEEYKIDYYPTVIRFRKRKIGVFEASQLANTKQSDLTYFCTDA